MPDPQTEPDSIWKRLEAIGARPREGDLEELAAYLGAADEDIRQEAAYLLGELRSDRAVPLLDALSNDPSTGVRKQAVKSLDKLDVQESMAVLERYTRDPDSTIADLARGAVMRLRVGGFR
jgi:HEAT repeat protein